MTVGSSSGAERRLRIRAEGVIATAGGAALEMVEELTDLGQAALAVTALGLLSEADAEDILVETADALAVRGADWLRLSLPSLPDVPALYEAATAPTVVTEALRELTVQRRRTTADEYLERLTWQQLVTVVSEATFDVMISARRRIAAAAEVLELPATRTVSLLAAFDRGLAKAGLVELDGAIAAEGDDPVIRLPAFNAYGANWFVPVEGRVGGWALLALEGRGDHWVAIVADAPVRAVWSAEDDQGGAYGAMPTDAGAAVRFAPALPEDWSHVALEIMTLGDTMRVVVRR